MAEIETAAPVSDKQYVLKHHCDFMLSSMSMDIGYNIIVMLSTSSSLVVDTMTTAILYDTTSYTPGADLEDDLLGNKQIIILRLIT
jgi:hypothetical protein